MLSKEIRQVSQLVLTGLADQKEQLLLEALADVVAVELSSLDPLLFTDQLSASIDRDKTTYYFDGVPFIWFDTRPQIYTRENNLTFRLRYGRPEVN